ncbi:hypothetical protein SEA_NICOLE72_19 [Microbacterium phage Nicole72]|uniref:Uncharacterized protein n=1 Tax=Microbacterium phage Nicole72 TaxID=3062838 RepID=A0ACD4ULN4_9CAUD|nr:hypothetical protein SEA_NICOLE72_19 [Microbacterium phage Nicole72]
MRTITITLTPQADDVTWADVRDAVNQTTPAMRSLPVNSEWSGDVDTYSCGLRVQVAVRDGDALDPATSDLDTLDTLMEALEDVRTIYTHLRLQEGVLADAVKAGDDAQAEFSQGRIGRHTVELAKAQERLEAAQAAHKAAHP